MPTPLTLSFVPAELDPAESGDRRLTFEDLEPLYEDLLARDLATQEALRGWLNDYGELASVVYEYSSRRNIDHACHTDDDAVEAAYLHFVRDVSPKLAPLGDRLTRQYLASPARDALEASEPKFALLGREWQTDADLYREANIPLFTQLSELNVRYDKRIGDMQVEFRSQTYTLQQLGRFFEEPDRETREEAWRLATGRRLEDREPILDIFDEMLKIRQQIADHAGFPDFRAYCWKSKKRFDYTPQDCLDFGDAVDAALMPRIRELDAERAAALGVESLRPWDTSVDLTGGSPLAPFAPEDEAGLIAGGSDVFRRVWPPLAEAFDTMRPGRNLDLKSRKGKRAGGFQATLSRVREPFIFMNAAGLQRDVDTLLHEGGHAFHYLWASAAEPSPFLQHAPLEFCEVASMSMELLGCDHYGVFYDDPAQAARAKRKQLEGVLRVLPWIATIDGFQHWLYTHPGHSRAQRVEAWRSIFSRFLGGVDYTALGDAFDARWQAQGHLFHVPFYYIEYGIAQLGSLQLWLNYKKDPAGTLSAYRDALSLGGTRPLPELFEAAGIRFKFDAQTLRPLVDAVVAELAELPG